MVPLYLHPLQGIGVDIAFLGPSVQSDVTLAALKLMYVSQQYLMVWVLGLPAHTYKHARG
jgi:hypothetical protein